MSKHNQERRRLRNAMSRAGKAIPSTHFGWVARDGLSFLCDQEACVVFESEEALRRLTALMAPDAYEHTTITFEEIVDLMRSEVVFAFDEGILNKFMARAMRNGLCLAADDRYVPNELDIHLTRIMLIQS